MNQKMTIRMIKYLSETINKINNKIEDSINLLNLNNINKINLNFQSINIMVYRTEIKVEEEFNNNSKSNKMLLLLEAKNLQVKKDNKPLIFFHKVRIIIPSQRVHNKLLAINKHQTFLINLNNLNLKEIKIDKDKWQVIAFLEALIIINLLKNNVN